MRLWSPHPRHLDPQGLVARWREATPETHPLFLVAEEDGIESREPA